MINSSRLFLSIAPAIALVLGVLGCTSEVSGGGDDGGGGDGGGGGDETCEQYTGVGCTPGDHKACSVPDPSGVGTLHGQDVCVVERGCETTWSSGCNTPLVLSFDNASVEFASDASHGFDVNGAASQVTDWPTARTPWLAMDRDGDGAIDDGRELFGSMSPLSSGRPSPNGFVALRELDANGDGQINAADPGFAKLSVWSDRDGDRGVSPGELGSAASWEIVSLDLDYTSIPRCDARGNCEVERAAFKFRDNTGSIRTGTIIDVRLPPQR